MLDKPDQAPLNADSAGIRRRELLGAVATSALLPWASTAQAAPGAVELDSHAFA